VCLSCTSNPTARKCILMNPTVTYWLTLLPYRLGMWEDPDDATSLIARVWSVVKDMKNRWIKEASRGPRSFELLFVFRSSLRERKFYPLWFLARSCSEAFSSLLVRQIGCFGCLIWCVWSCGRLFCYKSAVGFLFVSLLRGKKWEILSSDASSVALPGPRPTTVWRMPSGRLARWCSAR